MELYSVQAGAVVSFATGDDVVTIEDDIVSFLVKASYLTTAGDNKLLTAVVFPDGQS